MKALGDRPRSMTGLDPTPAPAPLGRVPPIDPAEALLKLIGSPDLSQPRLGGSNTTT